MRRQAHGKSIMPTMHTVGNFANFNDIKNALEKPADMVHAMVDTG
jgi:hypothetical protein